jgi:type IV pilus assembly protein PilV
MPAVIGVAARSCGFTLLEALIAIVVVMVGLLGIAHMLVASIGDTQLAMRYTTAAAFAAEIVDRARANPDGAALYAVDFGAAGVDHGCGTDIPVCSPEEQAEYDLFAWKSQLAAIDAGGLPEGDGEVEISANAGVTELAVTVRWDEKGEQLSYRLVAWI